MSSTARFGWVPSGVWFGVGVERVWFVAGGGGDESCWLGFGLAHCWALRDQVCFIRFGWVWVGFSWCLLIG